MTAPGDPREQEDGLREAIARCLAQLEPGEDWPTNEALGGGLTGTRDDEYRDAMYEQADAVLALPEVAGLREDAAEWEETAGWLGVQVEQATSRAEAAEAKVERMEALLVPVVVQLRAYAKHVERERCGSVDEDGTRGMSEHTTENDALTKTLTDALYSETAPGWYGLPEREEVARVLAPTVRALLADTWEEGWRAAWSPMSMHNLNDAPNPYRVIPPGSTEDTHDGE